MINLNNPLEFTHQGVATMIGSKESNSSEKWRIRVRHDGTAYMAVVTGIGRANTHAFTLPTMWGSYVGRAAQHDEVWVDRVYRTLKANWPRPSSEYPDWEPVLKPRRKTPRSPAGS